MDRRAMRRLLDWLYDEDFKKPEFFFYLKGGWSCYNGIYPFVRKAEVFWDFDETCGIRIRAVKGNGWARCIVRVGEARAVIKSIGKENSIVFRGKGPSLFGKGMSRREKNHRVSEFRGSGFQLAIADKTGNNSPGKSGLSGAITSEAGVLEIFGPQLQTSRKNYRARYSESAGNSMREMQDQLPLDNDTLCLCLAGMAWTSVWNQG